MNRDKTRDLGSIRSIRTFWSHLMHYLYVLRGLLGAQLVLVILCGIGFARLEGLSIWNGIYFALITATTVGFGDISPDTVIGQCISIALALIGTVFFGNLVAVSTQAFSMTIKEDPYLPLRKESKE